MYPVAMIISMRQKCTKMYIFIFMYIYAALYSFNITSNDVSYIIITFHKNLLHFHFSFFFFFWYEWSLPQNKFDPLHVKTSYKSLACNCGLTTFGGFRSFSFYNFYLSSCFFLSINDSQIIQSKSVNRSLA